jgi:hypothetical protein
MSNSAVVSTHPDEVKRPLDSLKANGWVLGISQPDSMTAIGELLDFAGSAPYRFQNSGVVFEITKRTANP